MVSTQDSESCDPSASLGRTFCPTLKKKISDNFFFRWSTVQISSWFFFFSSVIIIDDFQQFFSGDSALSCIVSKLSQSNKQKKSKVVLKRAKPLTKNDANTDNFEGQGLNSRWLTLQDEINIQFSWIYTSLRLSIVIWDHYQGRYHSIQYTFLSTVEL